MTAPEVAAMLGTDRTVVDAALAALQARGNVHPEGDEGEAYWVASDAGRNRL